MCVGAQNDLSSPDRYCGANHGTTDASGSTSATVKVLLTKRVAEAKFAALNWN
jgi:hypothetical protein